MPLTPIGVAGTLNAAFLGVGFTGTGATQLALGIGTGICGWTASTLVVTTIDTGTLGVGVGTAPCAIPSASLLASFLASFPGNAILGVGAPQLASAVADGLALAFLTQGLVTTAHPTVGTGTAIATFLGPSAIPAMLVGFASTGLTGTQAPQLATAIGLGLDTAFAAFSMPIPILGPPSILPSSGVGVGKII